MFATATFWGRLFCLAAGRPVLLLNDDRARPYLRSGDYIANPDLDQIAAAKLALDCQIDQRTVPKASLAIEEEANCPDLLLGGWALGAYLLSGIPCCALSARFVELGITNLISPRP